MSSDYLPLYQRLPEIYRIRDEEASPSGQLKSYLSVADLSFRAIKENIESLYDDLFIETCDEWVIPYIGDLLGVSHLQGDEWTLRADVADTILVRRRKGTIIAMERITENLTGWVVHCVELRENLAWNQHINHQRPDIGGEPPYSVEETDRFQVVRGGTVPVRDPAQLSLRGGAFDPFAYTADLKPPGKGAVRYNLPNLALYLWRLKDYTVPRSRPLLFGSLESGSGGEGVTLLRFHVDPLGRPVRLFNTSRNKPSREPPVTSEIDCTPGPIPRARLNEGTPAGRPESYVSVDTYGIDPSGNHSVEIGEAGLQFHVPDSLFTGMIWPEESGESWRIRGENLCGWENGLSRELKRYEIAIDPERGRIIIAVGDEEAEILVQHLLITYTYAMIGAVGAHPDSRSPAPEPWSEDRVERVSGGSGEQLQTAIADALSDSEPTIVEITDSCVYQLDIGLIAGATEEDGGSLLIRTPLLIRAASGERPIIRVVRPLRFRPENPEYSENCIVRLEGLYITADNEFLSADEPLVGRAALNRLEIINCTLDPGGHKVLDGSIDGARAPLQTSIRLREPYGFDSPEEEIAFDQTPEVIIHRSVTGSIRMDRGYKLELSDSVVDAGGSDFSPQNYAICGADVPEDESVDGDGWGVPVQVINATVLGRTRVDQANGRGGLFSGVLTVRNNQVGCLRNCYFSDDDDRLPHHHSYVLGSEAPVKFTSITFGEPGYTQLCLCNDHRILQRGPGDDVIGAANFLMESHKWRNLQIRYREFMVAGMRPLLILVT